MVWSHRNFHHISQSSSSFIHHPVKPTGMVSEILWWSWNVEKEEKGRKWQRCATEYAECLRSTRFQIPVLVNTFVILWSSWIKLIKLRNLSPCPGFKLGSLIQKRGISCCSSTFSYRQRTSDKHLISPGLFPNSWPVDHGLLNWFFWKDFDLISVSNSHNRSYHQFGYTSQRRDIIIKETNWNR